MQLPVRYYTGTQNLGHETRTLRHAQFFFCNFFVIFFVILCFFFVIFGLVFGFSSFNGRLCSQLHCSHSSVWVDRLSLWGGHNEYTLQPLQVTQFFDFMVFLLGQSWHFRDSISFLFCIFSKSAFLFFPN